MDFDRPDPEPLGLLEQWLEDAKETGLINPNAMTLATVDGDGRPSARTVLLKGLGPDGAVFYTNHRSRKATQLATAPRAALLFHWDPLARQAAIEGQVTPIDDTESDAYFASRDRLSQIGAWASDQSQPAEDRAALDERVAHYEREFADRDVPRPPHWGGYRVSLDRMEFWEGRLGRLHDRLVYVPDGESGWQVTRLFP